MSDTEDQKMQFIDSDDDVDMEKDEDGEEEAKVYLPGDTIQEGEELVCDQSAYMLYHAAQTGAPCLSFDLINDPELLKGASPSNTNLISGPLSMYMCAGTQSASDHANHVIVMRAYDIRPNKRPQEGEEEEDEDDDSDGEVEKMKDKEEEDDVPKAQMKTCLIKHKGSVNRIRHTCINNHSHIAATWSSESHVHLWDITQHLDDVQQNNAKKKSNAEDKPLYSFNGHTFEGYSMDWSTTVPGRLITGDCRKDIHLWTMHEGAKWTVDLRPFVGHTASVEDIQWSPNEDNVFMSCSVDKSIRVWDTRLAPTKACMLANENAHELDINVINWNKTEPFIISGGDDGIIKIWDLRQFKSGAPVAQFKHHSDHITSVEWHPAESSIFAAAGADNQLTQWDLAVEADRQTMATESNTDEPKVPPQLLFIHQGQTDLKELHWHQQHSGVVVSTAHSGFNIFRTISV